MTESLQRTDDILKQAPLSTIEHAQKTGETPTSTVTTRPVISVVIPAKDEAKYIKSLIYQVQDCLSEIPYEICIIDDGSTDGTYERARGNGATVISHGHNFGKGTAMKTGVQNTSGDIIIFLDGDGAHNPNDILALVEPIIKDNADFVIGSRCLPQSQLITSPLWRRLSNNLASFAISLIISLILPVIILIKHQLRWVKITDCTSGFRAIKREAWQQLNLTSQGFQIETEMIYEVARNHLTIKEAPIRCKWDCQSSRLSILRDGLRTLKLLSRKVFKEA